MNISTEFLNIFLYHSCLNVTHFSLSVFSRTLIFYSLCISNTTSKQVAVFLSALYSLFLQHFTVTPLLIFLFFHSNNSMIFYSWTLIFFFRFVIPSHTRSHFPLNISFLRLPLLGLFFHSMYIVFFYF